MPSSSDTTLCPQAPSAKVTPNSTARFRNSCSRVAGGASAALLGLLALRFRAQPFDLQLRQKRRQRMRSHFDHRRQIELDQSLALLGRQLEAIREGARVGQKLRALLGIMGKPVQ